MENWKPIPEWEGLYEVSDLSRVRSLDRMVTCFGGQRLVEGRIMVLKPPNRTSSYFKVGLRRPGERQWFQVHRLVAMAFIGPPPSPELAWVLHRDDNPLNNAIENLYWGTSKDNAADRIRHGTAVHGKRYWSTKMTEDGVRSIRRRYAAGESGPKIAADTGIHCSTVYDIINRLTWWRVA